MKVGSYIMEPYSAKPAQIVMRNVTSSPANAALTKQSWSCTYNGTGGTQTCACTNTTFPLPANLVGTNDSVVVAEVTYDYTPLVFDYFMKNTWRRRQPAPTARRDHLPEAARPERRCCCRPSKTPCPDPTF